MRTYWDLSEKDRAALTATDVERFVDAELMTKGVLKVTEPTLEKEPELPEPDVECFYVSAGTTRVDVAFNTADDARAFIATGPMIRQYHYLNGEFIYYVHTSDDWKITAERAHSKDLADLHRGTFALAKEAKARNEKLKDDHAKALKAQQEALADMWSDWRTQSIKRTQLEKVATTYESYTATAEGDRAIAFRFLRKSFDDAKIVEAAEWFGFQLPNDFLVDADRIVAAPQAAPAPVAESIPW